MVARGTNHVIRGLEFSPIPPTLGKGEHWDRCQLPMANDLIIHTCVMEIWIKKTHNTKWQYLESFWADEHIEVPGGWCAREWKLHTLLHLPFVSFIWLFLSNIFNNKTVTCTVTRELPENSMRQSLYLRSLWEPLNLQLIGPKRGWASKTCGWSLKWEESCGGLCSWQWNLT